MTKEEKGLLQRLAAGEFDGIVGDLLETVGGSIVWSEIKNGIPKRFKKGPGGKFFNGKENERYEGVLHILQEWITEESKLDFLRRFGFLFKDKDVKDYSAKFKPQR